MFAVGYRLSLRTTCPLLEVGSCRSIICTIEVGLSASEHPRFPVAVHCAVEFCVPTRVGEFFHQHSPSRLRQASLPAELTISLGAEDASLEGNLKSQSSGTPSYNKALRPRMTPKWASRRHLLHRLTGRSPKSMKIRLGQSQRG